MIDHPRPFALSPLDRLRSGTGSAPLTLPAVARPGLLDGLFASRSERELNRHRDAAVQAVEAERIGAATEVAVARIHDIKAVALRAAWVENDRTLNELETQVELIREEAATVQANNLNRCATEVVKSEHAQLTQLKALAQSDQIAPDRAQLVAELIRSNTDLLLTTRIDLSGMVREARKERDSRALSRGR